MLRILKKSGSREVPEMQQILTQHINEGVDIPHSSLNGIKWGLWSPSFERLVVRLFWRIEFKRIKLGLKSIYVGCKSTLKKITAKAKKTLKVTDLFLIM